MKNWMQTLSRAFSSVPLNMLAGQTPLFINLACLAIIVLCYFVSSFRPYAGDLYIFIQSDATGFLEMVYALGILSWFLAAMQVLICFAGKGRKRNIPGLCCLAISFVFFFMLIQPGLD